MARNANQKIHAPDGTAPLHHSFQRQGFFAQVNAARIRCQRNIQAIIDQDARGGRARFRNRETRKFDKSTRLKILLSNLNPARSGWQLRGE